MAYPHSSTTAPYWQACNDRRFLLKHCNACHKSFFYPRTGCPICGSDKLEWRQSSGIGTIYSYTHVQMALCGPSWDSEVPYTVILVDLDEGVRFLSRLVGSDHGKVKIGDRVRLEFVERDEQNLPCFALSPGEG
jgi:uncharacterized OB-fold protein